MKAMILAAGRGERLRPLTDRVPKPLIEAGGETLIGRHLRRLSAAGISDVVINLAHLGEQIRGALGDGEQFGSRIRYSLEPEGALETGGGIRNALDLLGDEPFLVINGDIWTAYPFEQLIDLRECPAHLVVVPNPPHNPRGDCDLDAAGRLLPGEGPLTFSGIGVYQPGLFAGRQPDRFPLWRLIQAAAARGEVTGERYQGAWFDVGAPGRLARLREFLDR